MASTGAWAQQNQPQCAIDRNETAQEVELVGKVSSNEALHGQYVMTIEKSGAGGRSSMVQRGGFDVASGHPARLGMVRFNRGPGLRYDVHLVISWDGGKQECRIGDGTPA